MLLEMKATVRGKGYTVYHVETNKKGGGVVKRRSSGALCRGEGSMEGGRDVYTYVRWDPRFGVVLISRCPKKPGSDSAFFWRQITEALVLHAKVSPGMALLCEEGEVLERPQLTLRSSRWETLPWSSDSSSYYVFYKVWMKSEPRALSARPLMQRTGSSITIRSSASTTLFKNLDARNAFQAPWIVGDYGV